MSGREFAPCPPDSLLYFSYLLWPANGFKVFSKTFNSTQNPSAHCQGVLMPPRAGQVEYGWGQGPDAAVARPPGAGSHQSTLSTKEFS